MIKARWNGVEQIEIVRDAAPPPPLLAPDDVRIRVCAAGVCGTDVHIWEGRLAISTPPLVLGHEFMGRVEECGPGVRGFSAGERVKCDSVVGCGDCEFCRRGATQFCPRGREFGITCDGGWSQYLVAPQRNLHRLPDSIPDDVAAIMDVEVLSALRKPGVNPDETVVVFGAGPAGLIALQCVRILGAGRVILCATRAERLALGKRLGADEIVDIRSADPVEQVRALTNGAGADLVFEASGAESAIRGAIAVLRPQGRAIFYGMPSGGVNEFPVQNAVLKDLEMYGSLPDRAGWDELISLVASARLNLASLITHHFPLEDAASALATMRGRRDGAIKAVLNCMYR